MSPAPHGQLFQVCVLNWISRTSPSHFLAPPSRGFNWLGHYFKQCKSTLPAGCKIFAYVYFITKGYHSQLMWCPYISSQESMHNVLLDTVAQLNIFNKQQQKIFFGVKLKQHAWCFQTEFLYTIGARWPSNFINVDKRSIRKKGYHRVLNPCFVQIS